MQMFKKIYQAFYLSIFIAAMRKIADKFKLHPESMNDYHVTIPFCDHCIIAGRYRSMSVAERAKKTLETGSGYKCHIVQASELRQYVATKCGGSSSSIFDDGKTTHYLGNRKILFFRGLVRACEREN